MAKLVWRVKLVAERHPGVTTETEIACIERDADVWLGRVRAAAGRGETARTPRPVSTVPSRHVIDCAWTALVKPMLRVSAIRR